MSLKSSLRNLKDQIGRISDMLDGEEVEGDAPEVAAQGPADTNAPAADRAPRARFGPLESPPSAIEPTPEYELEPNPEPVPFGDAGDGGRQDFEAVAGDDDLGFFAGAAPESGEVSHPPPGAPSYELPPAPGESAGLDQAPAAHVPEMSDESLTPFDSVPPEAEPLPDGGASTSIARSASIDPVVPESPAPDAAAAGGVTAVGPIQEGPLGEAEPPPPLVLDPSEAEEAEAPAPASPVPVIAAPSPIQAAVPIDPSDVDDEELDKPENAQMRDRVVRRLIKKEIIDERQLLRGFEEWKRVRREGYHIALWRVLTLDPDVNREQIYEEAASVYAFQKITVDRARAIEFVAKIVDIFDQEYIDRMLELFVIPVAQEYDSQAGDVKWIFVTHDPTRPEVNKLLQELRLKRFDLGYVSESLLGGIITDGLMSKNEYLDRLNENPMVYDLGTSFEEGPQLVDEEQLEAEINRSSLINLFEATLVESVKRGASDIHIFPNTKGRIEIHFRVDGELLMWHSEERVHPEAFLAVVKDNSRNVDRFERDTAQDGFIQRRVADTIIRYRVSILPIASHVPTVNAESIVIRVLDDRKVLTDLRKIGMLEQSLELFQRAIRQPHGMVILTGPTGSGKSTTLVAALHQVITPKVNVLTVEDPVEYLIRGVRQIKLNDHLDMEGALRAILRHDPDIVMVGEMRDKLTADLAIKLSNTGHLTFSTLHTNDAPSAVARLYKMGIEPFLIAYAINIIVAQRLIRKLCPGCKTEVEEIDRDLMGLLGFSDEELDEHVLYQAGYDPKCETCRGGGFKGRRAIAETLFFSDDIRRIVLRAGEVIDEDAIRAQGIKEGMLTLQGSAKEIVLMGDTSIDEMMRVTGS